MTELRVRDCVRRGTKGVRGEVKKAIGIGQGRERGADGNNPVFRGGEGRSKK